MRINEFKHINNEEKNNLDKKSDYFKFENNSSFGILFV